MSSRTKGFPLPKDLSDEARVKLVLGPAFVTAMWVIFRSRRAPAGRLLKAVGLLHMAGGSLVARKIIVRLFRRGLLGQADSGLGSRSPHVSSEMVFWFMLWGYYAYMLGSWIEAVESNGSAPPRPLSRQFALSTLVSAALYPSGGFWWMLVPAWLLLRESGEIEHWSRMVGVAREASPTEAELLRSAPSIRVESLDAKKGG